MIKKLIFIYSIILLLFSCTNNKTNSENCCATAVNQNNNKGQLQDLQKEKTILNEELERVESEIDYIKKQHDDKNNINIPRIEFEDDFSAYKAIHLTSYYKTKDAENGKVILNKKYNILSNLPANMENITINNKNYIRLKYGKFSNHKEAQSICDTLSKQHNQYCKVVDYNSNPI